MSAPFKGALLLFLLVPLFVACNSDPGTGAVEAKWDRDSCERCRMVLSDRNHSAQVRQPMPNGKSKVLMFDDIGCASLWLEDKPWRDDPRTEIWVTDHRTGEWIDARSATYIVGNVTPMAYGLGAQKESAPNGLDYAQAKKHIFETEERFNTHAAHLIEDIRDRQRERAANN
ncbi:MAG: nitrous oxide reductase accessory protein NosL [Sedimenticola sp.]